MALSNAEKQARHRQKIADQMAALQEKIDSLEGTIANISCLLSNRTAKPENVDRAAKIANGMIDDHSYGIRITDEDDMAENALRARRERAAWGM